MSKKSKDIISNALIELMKKEPLKEITISQIAANTSLVRKTFYNNFSTKEEVLEYIFMNLLEEYRQILESKEINTPKNISNEFFLFGKKNRELISLLIENQLFHLLQQQFVKIFPSINESVPSNSYLDLNKDDLEYVFAFHSAGVLQMLEMWIKSGFEKSVEEMSDLYHKICQGVQR